MKKWYLIPMLLLGIACSTEKSQTVSEEVTEEIEAVEEIAETPEEPEAEPDVDLGPEELKQKAIASFVGGFKAHGYDYYEDISHYNKINISVDSFSGSTIFGNSLVAGNSRPFTGEFQIEGNTIVAEAREPGDDRYDGVFTFTISPLEDKMSGFWSAYDTTLGVYKRKYDLDRTEYTYQPELGLPEDVGWADLANTYKELEGIAEFLTKDVLKKNPSVERLTKEDVENMYRGDLEIMRNSIYARHGYSFKNRKVRFIFDRYVDWYIPVSMDIRGKLTELELANIDIIKRYEEHADRYYDEYGR